MRTNKSSRIEKIGMKEKIGKQFIWQGFNIRWENYPHRLSVLGSRFNNIVYKEKNFSAYHDLHVKIGNFPGDAMHYLIPYSSVETENIFIGQGRTALIKTKSKRNREANKKQGIEFNLADLDSAFSKEKINAEDYDEACILLNGFHIQAENNVSGWHFGGLGISLDNLVWETKTRLSFDAHLHIRPAAAPEPFEHGNKDAKGKKWTAADPCIYGFEIDYTIILGNKKNMAVYEQRVKHSVERKYQTHCDENIEFKYDKEGYKNAFLGIKGFMICLHSQNPKAKRTGRYFRELGMYLSKVKRKKGSLTCITNIKFSNQSYPSKNLSANPWKMHSHINVACIASKKKLKAKQEKLSGRTGKSAQQHVLSNRVIS